MHPKSSPQTWQLSWWVEQMGAPRGCLWTSLRDLELLVPWPVRLTAEDVVRGEGVLEAAVPWPLQSDP